MPLGATYDSLRREIGRHLGYTGSLNAIESDTERNQDVEDVLARGQRKFFLQAGHPWSFLQRECQLTISSGVTTVDLPADYWDLIDTFSFAAASGISPLSIVTEAEIRAMRASADPNGPPKYAAVRARTVNDGQRYQLVLYPTPDADYEITGRYLIEPPSLSDDYPNPAGGALHSETLLMACICAADEKLNPEAGETVGCTRYKESLEKSIAADLAIIGDVQTGAWPLEDDDSPGDLGLTRDRIDSLIAAIMGFGPHPAKWSHGQRAELARIREQGLRRFYNPNILPGDTRAHRWGFLFPVLQIDLVADQSTYDLPENLAHIGGPLTFAPDSSVRRPAITLTSEPQVRHALTASTATGEPRQAATRPKIPQGDGPARQEILFYPRPDAAYTLRYRAALNPYAMSSGDSIPLGSPEHAETILAACLMVAEEYARVERPIHGKRFAELLRASVYRDRDRYSGDTVGQHTSWQGINNEAGDCDDEFYDRADQYVTYNGSVPS